MIGFIQEKHNNESLLKADGFDDAIIGIDENEMRLIYSVSKCLKILELQMSEAEALEHFTFDFNSIYLGVKTPIWCWDHF